MIDSAFAKIVESETKNMEIHFVIANSFRDSRLKSLIPKGMKKYQMKKAMLTTFHIWRQKLITKEKMEDYCLGKLYPKASVSDNLESLFEEVHF